MDPWPRGAMMQLRRPLELCGTALLSSLFLLRHQIILQLQDSFIIFWYLLGTKCKNLA